MITLARMEWRKQRKWRFVVAMASVFLATALGTYMMLTYLQQGAYSNVQSWLILLDSIDWMIDPIVIISITLVATLIMDEEHRSGMWTQLQLFPIPKWKYFCVKILAIIMPVKVLGILLMVSVQMGAYFTETEASIIDLIYAIYVPFLLAIPFIIFQTWVSMITQSPVVPISVGVSVFLFLNVFDGWGIWLPWGPLASLSFHPTTPIIVLLITSILVIMLTIIYFIICLKHFKTKQFL